MANSLYLHTVCEDVCGYVCSDTSSMCSSHCTHAQLHQHLVIKLATLNNAHQRNQPWPPKKSILDQQQSKRDHDCQQREAETPEGKRRLGRLKHYRK